MEAGLSVKKRRQRSVVVAGNRSQSMQSLTLLLRRFDYEVTEAYAASEALSAISAVPAPALVITDVILPGMSGTEMFRTLKQTKRTASIPVVFTVPMSDAAAERQCYDLGAAGCITKPVRAEEVYRVVQAVVEPIPRGNIRIDAWSPVSVNNEPVSGRDGACAIGLSEHGMYVPTSKLYPRNGRLTLQFHLKDRTISAVGSVLYSSTSLGQDREPGIGLKFVTIAPQDREFIRSFIREEIARDLAALSSVSHDPWR
jgi:CheY-like chemotaxis protein